MTDNDFKHTVAKALLALNQKIDAQTEVLRALNEQQREMNKLLLDWCEAMEKEQGDTDPFGLFDDDGDADGDDKT